MPTTRPSQPTSSVNYFGVLAEASLEAAASKMPCALKNKTPACALAATATRPGAIKPAGAPQATHVALVLRGVVETPGPKGCTRPAAPPEVRRQWAVDNPCLYTPPPCCSAHTISAAETACWRRVQARRRQAFCALGDIPNPMGTAQRSLLWAPGIWSGT